MNVKELREIISDYDDNMEVEFIVDISQEVLLDEYDTNRDIIPNGYSSDALYFTIDDSMKSGVITIKAEDGF